MYPQSMSVSKNMKMIKKHTKIVIFTAVKNRCLLHGRVFVMLRCVCVSDQSNEPCHDIKTPLAFIRRSHSNGQDPSSFSIFNVYANIECF